MGGAEDRDYKGHEETPGVMVMFTLLIVAMVPQVFTYVKMCHIVHFKRVAFLCVSYFSIKLLCYQKKERGVLEFTYPNVEITSRARLQTVY